MRYNYLTENYQWAADCLNHLSNKIAQHRCAYLAKGEPRKDEELKVVAFVGSDYFHAARMVYSSAHLIKGSEFPDKFEDTELYHVVNAGARFIHIHSYVVKVTP